MNTQMQCHGNRLPHFYRSRGVVRIQAKLTFEPEKVNIFNKDCQRGRKEVTCMSVTVCLTLESRTKTEADVGKWKAHKHILDFGFGLAAEGR